MSRSSTNSDGFDALIKRGALFVAVLLLAFADKVRLLGILTGFDWGISSVQSNLPNFPVRTCFIAALKRAPTEIRSMIFNLKPLSLFLLSRDGRGVLLTSSANYSIPTPQNITSVRKFVFSENLGALLIAAAQLASDYKISWKNLLRTFKGWANKSVSCNSLLVDASWLARDAIRSNSKNAKYCEMLGLKPSSKNYITSSDTSALYCLDGVLALERHSVPFKLSELVTIDKTVVLRKNTNNKKFMDVTLVTESGKMRIAAPRGMLINHVMLLASRALESALGNETLSPLARAILPKEKKIYEMEYSMDGQGYCKSDFKSTFPERFKEALSNAAYMFPAPIISLIFEYILAEPLNPKPRQKKLFRLPTTNINKTPLTIYVGQVLPTFKINESYADNSRDFPAIEFTGQVLLIPLDLATSDWKNMAELIRRRANISVVSMWACTRIGAAFLSFNFGALGKVFEVNRDAHDIQNLLHWAIAATAEVYSRSDSYPKDFLYTSSMCMAPLSSLKPHEPHEDRYVDMIFDVLRAPMESCFIRGTNSTLDDLATTLVSGYFSSIELDTTGPTATKKRNGSFFYQLRPMTVNIFGNIQCRLLSRPVDMDIALGKMLQRVENPLRVFSSDIGLLENINAPKWLRSVLAMDNDVRKSLIARGARMEISNISDIDKLLTTKNFSVDLERPVYITNPCPTIFRCDGFPVEVNGVGLLDSLSLGIISVSFKIGDLETEKHPFGDGIEYLGHLSKYRDDYFNIAMTRVEQSLEKCLYLFDVAKQFNDDIELWKSAVTTVHVDSSRAETVLKNHFNCQSLFPGKFLSVLGSSIVEHQSVALSQMPACLTTLDNSPRKGIYIIDIPQKENFLKILNLSVHLQLERCGCQACHTALRNPAVWSSPAPKAPEAKKNKRFHYIQDTGNGRFVHTHTHTHAHTHNAGCA